MNDMVARKGMDAASSNVKVNHRSVGPLVSYQQVTAALPKRERMVYHEILKDGFTINPGQFTAMEVDLFQISKSLGMKHDQVSDAVRSLSQRLFHVRQGESKVFEYPLVIVFGYYLKHTERPSESVLLAFPHETEQADDNDESWTTGEQSIELAPSAEA
jgi:hypothetical protein